MAPAPLLNQAVERLKRGQRREAARLLDQDVRSGGPPTERWAGVSRLAAQIGEIDIAIAAARLAIDPPTLDKVLRYWATLATYGRSDEALADLARLPAQVQNHPAVLHFRGTIASENGDFAIAEELFRKAIESDPLPLASWFGLTTIKTFCSGDPDLAAMESLLGKIEAADPETRARFLYALGKACEDAGNSGRAFDRYAQGAALRRQMEPYDRVRADSIADKILSDFSSAALARLTPSQAATPRSIFVTGLPRSGTTLVQQILTAHSRVSDGGEVNLMHPALIPTLGLSFDSALAYQARSASDDPWGEVARDYAHFIDMRFRGDGLVVDKSLSYTLLIGLLLHSLPTARMILLRRDPADCALSCYRTYFTSPAPWSWSLADIAHHFRTENRLFDHWIALFAKQILVVPYEQLVRDPKPWIERILDHTGLEPEAQVQDFHLNQTTVKTASFQQVREPISTARVGQAASYGPLMDEFRQHFGRLDA